MKTTSALLALVLCVALAGLWYANRDDVILSPVDSNDSSGTTAETESFESDDSPFAVVQDVAPLVNTPASTVRSDGSKGSASRTQKQHLGDNDVPSWDDSLSEADLVVLVAQLRDNPEFLNKLVDEFRQETDPARKQRLANILGEVGGEQVTLLASELIFSGSTQSRALGMDLLQQVQPGNAQARDIVSGMLATEVEPTVLIDAITALAIPGEVDSESRSYLSEQIAWLSTHEDVSVRGISLDILSRWSTDGQYTDVLLAGLDDPSVHVRTAAAYALLGHEDTSPQVVDRLFDAVVKTSESKGVKEALVLALKSMPLSSQQREELSIIERRLHTRTTR